jgi:hypothetical protein
MFATARSTVGVDQCRAHRARLAAITREIAAAERADHELRGVLPRTPASPLCRRQGPVPRLLLGTRSIRSLGVRAESGKIAPTTLTPLRSDKALHDPDGCELRHRHIGDMRRQQQAHRGCQDRLLAGSLQGALRPIHGRRRVGISQTYVLPRHRRRGIDRQHYRLYLAQVLLLDDLGRKSASRRRRTPSR